MITTHTLAALIVAGNDDLLTQILLRLPIRSLLRFKSVSKHWLSLISNPTFSLLRNSLSPNNPISGLILRRSSRLINPEFDFVPLNNNNDDPPANPQFRRLNFDNNPCGIRILQSCNGLLLCCGTIRGFNGESSFYIYNPTTNKFITLPHPNRRVFRYFPGNSAINIAFDPSKSSHYKAVCVYPSKSESQTVPQHYEIEIYSSETGLWTPSGDPFAADVHFSLPVYWNGSIHWISTWSDSLYFNLNTECIGIMPPMPSIPGSWDEKRYPFLCESGGHLHLIVLHGRPRTTHFNLYEMERDYSNWFVKYYVDLDSIPSAFPEMIRRSLDPHLYNCGFTVLDVVRGEKEDDSFLVLGILGKAIRYNFVDNTFNKLCDFIPDDPSVEFNDILGSLDFGGWVDSYQYIESLASV